MSGLAPAVAPLFGPARSRTATFLPVEDDVATRSSPDEDHAELLSSFGAMIELLHQAGEAPWSDRLTSLRDGIERGERHAFDAVLQSFGGMGSLSDLVLHPANGHEIEVDEIPVVNGRLDQLRSSLWSAARRLQRGLD